MPRWNRAVYLGPPDGNWGGSRAADAPWYLVEHTAEGSYSGTIGWQTNPASQVSSHFVIGKGGFRTGEVAQMLDLDLTAWTQADGNSRAISAELAGDHLTPYTPEQQEVLSALYAFLVETFGPARLPLQLTDSPSVRGWGWHGMGGAAWGGHPDCPGPANVALRAPMLVRAEQILNGGDDMGMTQTQALVTWNTGWIVQGALNMDDPVVIPAHTATDDEPWSAPRVELPNKLARAILAAGGGSGGEGGPSLAEITASMRAELDKTGLGLRP